MWCVHQTACGMDPRHRGMCRMYIERNVFEHFWYKTNRIACSRSHLYPKHQAIHSTRKSPVCRRCQHEDNDTTTTTTTKKPRLPRWPNTKPAASIWRNASRDIANGTSRPEHRTRTHTDSMRTVASVLSASNDVMCRRHVFLAVVLLQLTVGVRLTVQLSASSTQQQRGGDEICETLPSEIHLIKGSCV